MPPKKYAKKSSRRPRKYARKVSRKPRATFAKKVQAIISRNIENKTIQSEWLNVPVLNYNNVTWLTNCFGIPMGPYLGYLEIGQGTTQGNRIGNEIKLKKLTFRGVLYPAAYNASTNSGPRPHEIKFWFVTQKDQPSEIPITYNKFFQDGSTSQTFDANLLDLIKVVNSDLFMVHTTRTFKLGQSEYFGSGTNPNNQYWSNNDFNMNAKFSFDLTKYHVKNIKYNDGSNQPMTRGIFLVVEAIWANGSSSTVTQADEVANYMSYQVSMDYEDA